MSKMITKIRSISILFIIVSICFSCRQQPKQKISSKTGELIANTITYDVLIKADTDESFLAESVRGLDRKIFIDSLFHLVYSGRIMAYDFFTKEYISPDELLKIEKSGEFTRDDISKIQFEEQWFINYETLQMNKEVISLVLGYSYYGESGDLRHKPVFKIKLK